MGLKNYKYEDGEVMLVVTASGEEEARKRLKKRLKKVDELEFKEQVV